MSLFSPYVLIGIVVAVLGSYGAGRVQQWHRDEVSQAKQVAEWKAQVDEERLKREAQWSKAVDAGEAALKGKIDERNRQLASAQQRVANLDSAVASCRAAGIGRLLNQSIRESADAAGTGTKPEGSAAPATDGADVAIGEWAKWSVEAVNLYARCRDQVIGWQTFYGKLRGTPN